MGYLTPESSVNYYNGSISISGRNANKKESIGFSISPISDTGTVYFPNGVYSIATYSMYGGDKTIEFISEPIVRGKVTLLRFDKENGIYSGTFEFDVYDKYNLSDMDTIHITDGRFDLLD